MSRFDIKAIAELARLELNEDEAVAYQQDLEAILGYVEKMAELDLADVEPTTRAVEMSDIYREDVVGQSLSRERVIQNAPENIDEELIRVPVVIEGAE